MKNFRYGTDRLTLRSALALTQGQLQTTLSAKVRHKVDGAATFAKEMNAPQEEESPLPDLFRQPPALDTEPPTPLPIVKTMMILKAQALAKGYSGIELRTLERMIWMTEKNIVPVVPTQSSTVPTHHCTALTHLFLPLVGRGKVYYKGSIVPAETALKTYGISPLQLGPKEIQALMNGTQFITAYAVRALYKLHNLLEIADIAGALSLEGLKGSYKPFAAHLHQNRPFPGNQLVAHRLWELLRTSEIANSHPDLTHVKDPEALRCMPQVHGASRAAWLHLKELTEIEMNAISSGNSHDQPLAVAIHYATIGATKLENISERRSQLIIEQHPDLQPEGHTPLQPPAKSAAEKTAGIDRLNEVIDNIEYRLATELMLAARALDSRRPLTSSKTLEACYRLIKEEDNVRKLRYLISSGVLLNEVNQAAKLASCQLSKAVFSVFDI